MSREQSATSRPSAMSFWVGGIHICRSAARTLRSGILNKAVQRGWKARGEFPGPSPRPRLRPRLSVTGAPILEAHSISSLSGMMPRGGVERLWLSRTSSILSISPRDRALCVVARDQDVFFDAPPLLGLLGLGIEKSHDAIGIANRRHFRVGHDHSGIGVSHRQRCAALDASRAVADHPVEFIAQLLDGARDALFGQRILCPGSARPAATTASRAACLG